MNIPVKSKRRKVRFASDPSQHAEIELHPTPGDFTPDLAAVICNESYRGCCIVAVKNKQLQEGARIRIKVGRLAPLLGEVKWVTDLDVEVAKFGIEFLE